MPPSATAVSTAPPVAAGATCWKLSAKARPTTPGQMRTVPRSAGIRSVASREASQPPASLPDSRNSRNGTNSHTATGVTRRLAPATMSSSTMSGCCTFCRSRSTMAAARPGAAAQNTPATSPTKSGDASR